MDRNKVRIAAIDGIIDVALRKESVDRNAIVNTVIFCIMGSLSARRAWIEIGFCEVYGGQYERRSPQGERG